MVYYTDYICQTDNAFILSRIALSTLGSSLSSQLAIEPATGLGNSIASAGCSRLCKLKILASGANNFALSTFLI